MDRYVTMSVRKRKTDDSDNESETSQLGTPSKSAKRLFKDYWLSDPEFSSFLKYDACKKVMLCKMCLQCQYINSFTTGCSVMKKESIIKNTKSKGN